jgi:hypothetical protein
MKSPTGSFLNRLGGFCFLALQLGLIAWVVRGFEIESQEHFPTIFCVAAVGFLVHWWLPPGWRLYFFNALSLGTIAFVLGWPDAAWTLGIGAGLIVLCTRPIRWIYRGIALGAVALLLVNYRIEQTDSFWPVLASMFMFRLIVYLFEVRRETAPTPLPLTVAYFMPLQNIGFLFFPILDFKTWRDCYRPDIDWPKAQIGIGHLVRGLSHLVAYRIVKYFLLPSPFELGDWPHLALFLAMNYALYLHVSGCFHIITGIFHLFGFAMPRTHDNYFLASSITDIWRRINIYWRDFMMKLFFFPMFFRLRGLGTRWAVTIATLGVFLATWFLHVYQVFWMTRTIPFRLYDAGLWLGAGLIVVLNIQLELSRARRPGATAGANEFRASLCRALGIAGTFTLVSFFWACWNTPQVLPSVRAVAVSQGVMHGGMGTLLATLACAILLLAVLLHLRARLQHASIWPKHASPAQVASVCVPILIAGGLLALPQAPVFLSPHPAGLLSALRYQSVLPVEAAMAVQGYYEDMARVRAPAGAWLSQLEGKPYAPPVNHYREMSRETDELLERELIPNFKGLIDGGHVTVNQYGMRDREDRTPRKPPGVCRLALVGSSVVMGYSVNDDQTFAHLLEEDLNQGKNAQRRVEVLNFGTGRSYVIQRHVLMDRKVFAFEPDAIYWFAHQDEYFGSVNHVAMLVDKDVKLPYPGLQEIVEEAGVRPGMPRALVEAMLRPRSKEIVACVYRDAVQACRERGILPVWVYLPMPGVVELSIKSDELVALARDAGFVIVNLADWADGFRSSELIIGDRDYHASVSGNQLIAAKLAAHLRADPAPLPVCAR